MVLADVDRSHLADQLSLPRYPRSGRYDPAWMVDNCMGPNPLWLAEWLTGRMALLPGMRVLDLGCGAAMTSIFLAREYGVSVVAADLWIKPGENWPRIRDAGVAGTVLPLHAEAHDLPFAEGYFDVIVSIDAYHYFGTDDLYIGYISTFLAAGGQLAVAVPALTAELDAVPDWLATYWDWDFASFHTAQWWRRSWERTGKVDVEVAEEDPEAWRDWLLWCDVCATASESDFVRRMSTRSAQMLRADKGRTFTFAGLVARRCD